MSMHPSYQRTAPIAACFCSSSIHPPILVTAWFVTVGSLYIPKPSGDSDLLLHVQWFRKALHMLLILHEIFNSSPRR